MVTKTINILFKPKNFSSVDSSMKKINTAMGCLTKQQVRLNRILIVEEGLQSNILRIIQSQLVFIEGKLLSFGAGKFSNPFKSMAFNLGLAKNSGLGLFKSLGAGMTSFASAATVEFGGLIGMAGSLVTALAPFIAVILAIVAIIYLFKKAWENNVGGIVTRFHKSFGKLKLVFAKFSVGLNKLMRAVSPLIKPFVDMFFNLVDIIYDVLIPAIEKFFNITIKAVNALTKVFKVLGLIQDKENKRAKNQRSFNPYARNINPTVQTYRTSNKSLNNNINNNITIKNTGSTVNESTGAFIARAITEHLVSGTRMT